jgi:hypothetical protein
MNKLSFRPSAILTKAQPRGARRTQNSTKVLGATLATLFVLCGTVGICLAVFSAIKARTPKGPAGVASLPPVKGATPADKGDGTVTPQPAANQAGPETVAADHSTPDQSSMPAVMPTVSPTPASVPVLQDQQKASVNDREFLESKVQNVEPKNPDRKLSGIARKNLEKERREAERKRSRLEEMYQKHEISSEAYKQGEEEYKSEIEKYRAAVNAG